MQPDHASTKPPLAPPFTAPTPYTHKHAHTPAGIWWNLIYLRSGPDRTQSDVKVNLWMLWEQPTPVTNIAHFAVSRVFIWQEDTVKSSYRWLKGRLQCKNPRKYYECYQPPWWETTVPTRLKVPTSSYDFLICLTYLLYLYEVVI